MSKYMNLEITSIVINAFLAAQKKGNENWRIMTLGVLKNRMIQMTHGDFDEKKYGFNSFLEMASSVPDVLSINAEVRPIVVELVADITSGSDINNPPPPQRRIRSDLWRAVTDYRSGRKYILDEATSRAISYREENIAPGKHKILPTIQQSDLEDWRRDFVEKYGKTLPGEGPVRAQKWLEHRLAINFLPTSLRSLWANTFSNKVYLILKDWFKANNLSESEIDHSIVPPDTPVETESNLRDYIIQCISLMTKEELEQVQLPVSVIFRARSPE